MEFKCSASLHLAFRTHLHTKGWLLAHWEKCGLHCLNQTFNRGIFWIPTAILRIQDGRIQDGSSTVIVEVRLVEGSHNTRTMIEPPTSQCEGGHSATRPLSWPSANDRLWTVTTQSTYPVCYLHPQNKNNTSY